MHFSDLRKILALGQKLDTNFGNHQRSVDGYWLHAVYDKRKRCFFLLVLESNLFLSELVNNKAKFTIIVIRIVNPVADYDQTFKCKKSYALVPPQIAFLDSPHYKKLMKMG